MTIVFLISVYVTISLWEHCMKFKRAGILPHAAGYDAFSVLQWGATIAGLIHAFGWLWGSLIFVGFISILPTFILGIFWGKLFKESPRQPLALFSIMVWVTVGLSGAHFIWGTRHF